MGLNSPILKVDEMKNKRIILERVELKTTVSPPPCKGCIFHSKSNAKPCILAGYPNSRKAFSCETKTKNFIWKRTRG